ncbi:tetratricopeptide repeat protein [Actinoallomurus purpureus]|uniref:ATP-binding protein n=1 Tax=Actinoallomurus purpureus TaxID=478114 RepID=UPI00209224BB|nr:tetratricopeptide repeat protein [Actinoallomurus purpureus]MCO6007528.1 tetratricopeptide repeat protein [Actinoallomurus purpureus]
MTEADRIATSHNEFTGGRAENVIQVRDIYGNLVVPERTLPVPKQLPHGVARFTDRTAALDQLDSTLAASTAGPLAVLISGTAGVGKTALSIHWAQRVRERYPDGQLYVNLHGYHRRPPMETEQVLDGFLRALDVDPDKIPAELEAMIGLYRTHLNGKRVLVVLDNANSAEQVRPLLPPSEDSLALVTSRSRLSGLVVQEGAVRLILPPLEPEAAVQLFESVVGPQAQADAELATALVQRAGCLPLTVLITAEQAAARHYLDLAEMLEELEVESDRLDAFATTDKDMEVRSVFSWSYRELAPEVARMFRLLGLHAGPDISVPAAAALAGLSVTAARRALITLTGVSMVEDVARDRYRFHDLIRNYAVEQVNEVEPVEERNNAIRQELTWYLYTADAVDRLLAPQRRHVPLDPPPEGIHPLTFSRYEDALNWCEAERPNLLAAVEQAAAIGADDIAWKLPVALIMFFHWRKHRMNRLSTTLTALDAARRAHDRYGEAWSLICIGGAYADLKRFDEAAAQYQQAEVICREIGDRQGEGMSLVNVSFALRGSGRDAEAIDYAERALPVWREINDRRNEVITLNALADASCGLGRLTDELSYYEQALPVAREVDKENEGVSLHGLGTVHQRLGDAAAAIDFFRQAITVRREIGDSEGQAVSLYALGGVLRDTGDREAAREAFTEALAIFESLKDATANDVRRDLAEL